jgi:hypothetical protein
MAHASRMLRRKFPPCEARRELSTEGVARYTRSSVPSLVRLMERAARPEIVVLSGPGNEVMVTGSSGNSYQAEACLLPSM